jgi:hypothetical protein
MSTVTLKTEHGGEITIDKSLIEDYLIEPRVVETPSSNARHRDATVGWIISLVLHGGGLLANIPITNLDELDAALQGD